MKIIELVLLITFYLTSNDAFSQRESKPHSGNDSISYSAKYDVSLGEGGAALSSGVSIAYNHSVSHHFGISYKSGKAFGNSNHGSFRLTSVNHSYFWTQTFFTSYSLGYHYFETIRRSGSSYEEYKTDAILGKISIGNEWKYSNFILGVEWFGLGYQLFKLKESAKSSHDEFSGKNSHNRNSEAYFSAIKLYIGVGI